MGVSQRRLAEITGVAQPTIARIERGQVDPRLSTVDLLLSGLHIEIDVRRAPGTGVDRSQLREMLRRTPRERLELLTSDASGLERLLSAAGRR